MKKITLGLTLLLSAGLIITACKKDKNVVPEPDTETQTAVDASWATFVISDIEMMCSFMGENQLLKHFYTEVPGSASGSTGTMTATRDTNAFTLNMGFNKTQCIDGRFRDGTVFMRYFNFSPGEKATFFPNNKEDSKYTRSFGFGGFLTLSEYKVDNWKVETVGGTPAILRNELSDPGYDPSKVKLTWTLQGRFKLTHPTDTNKNIYWDGVLTKTCENSTSKTTFSATTNHKTDGPILWEKAIISYSGKISGRTNINQTFTMEITPDAPMTRDFTCYPNKVAGVVLTNTPGVIQTRPQELHPFISGIATFTTVNESGKELYPRRIYYGNEGVAENPSAHGCDNQGEVYIKGVSYKVSFKE